MTELTKWPGMLVAGARVTPDQAAEIIVRCQHFSFISNDHYWNSELREACGLPGREPRFGSAGWEEYHRSLNRLREEARTLDVDYLGLADRVATCYIGGPKGWVNWDGTVFCNSYNIGKWPTVLGVWAEWREIARAFPFLRLRCQLLDHEIYEGAPDWRPVVEFRVRDGDVEVIEVEEDMSPDDLLLPPAPTPLTPATLGTIILSRGCALSQFRRGLHLAKGKA